MSEQIRWAFKPRSYQRALYNALRSGVKRAVCTWHRRSGKDTAAFNWMILQAIQIPGTYYYFFPTYAQGKKIIWNGIDSRGQKVLDYIPKECILSDPHETEMYIKLRTLNGAESLFQIIGTDNIDSIVGTNPTGCVFSEYSLQDPKAWEFVSPILEENNGWALFLFTPRGKNHAYRIFQVAKRSEHWYCSFLTADETRRDAEGEAGGYVFSPERIQRLREEGRDEEIIQQEYYCSFQGSMQGSVFGNVLHRAEMDGRIGNFPLAASNAVNTAWDIGVGDATAIWFWQYDGKSINFIDYLEHKGELLTYYAKQLKDKPDYVYDWHVVPHDMKVREWGSDIESRLVSFRQLIGRNVTVAKKPERVEEGIDLTRRLFYRFRFDQRKCVRGLDALNSYHRKRNDTQEIFSDKPVHDWASHASSALITLASAFREDQATVQRQTRAETNFDPMTYEQDYESDFDPFRD